MSIGALQRLGRNDAPRVLIEGWAIGTITEQELRENVLHVWDGAEWPLRCADAEVWRMVFEATGQLLEVEVEPVTTLYRAQVGDEIGMSWTPQKKTARWFHERNVSFGFDDVKMLEAQVPRKAVLAAFEARDGVEYIVAPELIEKIEVIR